MTTTDPTAGQVISGVAIIGVVAVVLYVNLFGSDRAVVTRCIDVMMDASRGQGVYGEFLDLKRDVDAAQSIVITNRRDTPFGGTTLTALEFNIDGRASRLTCSM